MFSIIGVLLGFFAAGVVAGAMSVCGGLVHGFLTWAASNRGAGTYLAVDSAPPPTPTPLSRGCT